MDKILILPRTVIVVIDFPTLDNLITDQFSYVDKSLLSQQNPFWFLNQCFVVLTSLCGNLTVMDAETTFGCELPCTQNLHNNFFTISKKWSTVRSRYSLDVYYRSLTSLCTTTFLKKGTSQGSFNNSLHLKAHQYNPST